MARRPALSGFSLDLFGGGGVDAGVFNIASQSRQNEAYLALVRVETQWEAGQVTDDTYLAALETYANTFAEGSAERLNKLSSLAQTRYRIERNVLVGKVDRGQKTWGDLLAYDQSKLAGLNPDSQEYRDREDRLFSTQNQILNDEEKDVVARYQNGKMTTTQLQSWYRDRLADPRFAGNVELAKAVTERITELAGRVVAEQDAKVISDYSSGKMSPADFLAYAGRARARYAEGTSDATDWDKRIEQAKDAAVEDDLAYRYSLSQDYLRLQQFVQSNSAPAGGTSTSHQTRTVLGADGQWRVVTSTVTKPYAPSKSEVEAWKKRQIEVAEAKRQMASIATKLAGLPGGFVQTGEMIAYYKAQLTDVARGSQEWYAIQGKIDSLNDALSSEKVLSRQGIKLSFPKVKSERRETYQLPKGGAGGAGGQVAGMVAKPSGKTGGSGTLDDFMRAIAKIESGGRYDARNSSSGAYGKYQIMPANWSNWAQRAGLPANAPQTPENQEKVARAAFGRLFNKYDGDFAMMAAEWFAGAAGARGGSASWGPKTRRYVSNVLAAMGTSYSPGRTAGAAATTYSPKGGGGGTGTPAPTSSGAPNGLRVIVGAEAGAPTDTTSRNRDRNLDRGDTWDPLHALTMDIPFPSGMDARQFRKVYDAIESAWQQGQQTAYIDTGNGQRMAVFLGDDPLERVQIMNELDDMRVGLADTELDAYKGTSSEASKSQSAVAARKDAARHDLLALDLAGTSGGAMVNPVTQGIRVLDTIVAGVSKEVALANEAYKRGDLTQAYLHVQRANSLAEPADVAALLDYVEKANVQIARVTGATGLTTEQLLSGAGTAGTEMKGDLARLAAFDTEIQKAFEPGVETSTLLDNQLRKDADGNVIWQGRDVVLSEDFVRMVKPNGQIEIIRNTDRDVAEDGSIRPVAPEGTSRVFMRSGTSVIDAFAAYKVGKVGYATMPDGSKVPIFGKVVSVPIDRNGDGQADGVQAYFENPLNPGKWSASPVMFRAPAGSTVVFATNGSKQPAIQYVLNGTKYTLQLDDKTGVYQVWKNETTGIPPFQQTNPTPVMVGTGGQSPEAQAAVDAFGRDLSGLSDMDRMMADLEAPALNMTPDQWADFRYKPVVVPTAAIGAGLGMRAAIVGATSKAAVASGNGIRYQTSRDTRYTGGTTGTRRYEGLEPIPPREVPQPGVAQPAVAGTTGPVQLAPLPTRTPLPGLQGPGSATARNVDRITRPAAKPQVTQKRNQTVVNTGGKSRKRAGGIKKIKPLPKPVITQPAVNTRYGSGAI